MRILFLTLLRFDDPIGNGIYQDLVHALADRGHFITVLCPNERKFKRASQKFTIGNISVIQVDTLNLQKVNWFEKVASTLLIQHQYKTAIKKHIADQDFDMVLYSTPPITFFKVVKYVKKTFGAISYLLLKDIFPQNAVDLKLFGKGSLPHRYFSTMEKSLYLVSDFIGCMSPANVNYLKKHHPYIKAEIEVNPNSLYLKRLGKVEVNEQWIEQFNIPTDRKIIIYGGNLGKPQGIEFLIKSIQITFSITNKAYFIIAGDGLAVKKVVSFFNQNPSYGQYIQRLSNEEFLSLVSLSDLGLVHLMPNFTIPNYPSRILPYMECRKPILAAVDEVTDISETIVQANCGWSCNSNDSIAFATIIHRICANEFNLEEMGENGYEYMIENFDADVSARLIEEKQMFLTD